MSARLLITALLLLPAAARAQEAQYDSPVSTRAVKAGDTEIRCTYYQDLMVREAGTDTPSPDPASLIPGNRPTCSAGKAPQLITLPISAFSFVGRKGPYLIFSGTDPNGAVPFAVVNLAGKVLYSDSTAIDRGIRSVAVENDALHIQFTRGLNASCSIMQGAGSCWSKLMAAGKIPRVMANAGPSSHSCAPAYRQAKAPPDDPSMIAYDVDMMVDATGKTQVMSRGSVSCGAMP